MNNGSTDNSKQICQEFADKYSQFKLISLDSAGVSNARNIGLKYASGTYIMFCDSDDIPSPYWVSYLYDAITKNKVDMGVCRYIRFRSVSAIKQDALPLNNAILVGDLNDQIKNVLTDPMYAGYLRSKSFILQNNYISYGLSSSTSFLNTNPGSWYTNNTLKLDLIKILIELGKMPLIIFVLAYYSLAYESMYAYLVTTAFLVNLLMASGLNEYYAWLVMLVTFALIRHNNVIDENYGEDR